MANKSFTDFLRNVTKRLINTTSTYFAELQAVILYDSSEAELLTVANPGNVAIIGGVDVDSVPATELHLGEVGGKTVVAIDTVTRPANATQYAVGDQLAAGTPAALEFALPRIAGGTGIIVHAVCAMTVNLATKPSLRLYLFTAEPTAIAADNAAWTPSDADMATVIGYVEFTSWEEGLAGVAGNCASFAVNLSIPFDCVAGVIYGLAVYRNTYTPAASEIYTLKLGALLD